MHLSKIFLLIVVSLFAGAGGNKLFAQLSKSGTVKGVLIDSLASDTITGATVSIFTRNDTTLVSSVISRADGSFSISTRYHLENFYCLFRLPAMKLLTYHLPYHPN